MAQFKLDILNGLKEDLTMSLYNELLSKVNTIQKEIKQLKENKADVTV